MSIKLFDIETYQEIGHFPNTHQGSSRYIIQSHNFYLDIIVSIVISSDNSFIVTGSRDKSIKIFNLKNKQETHCFPNAHPSQLTPLIFD